MQLGNPKPVASSLPRGTLCTGVFLWVRSQESLQHFACLILTRSVQSRELLHRRTTIDFLLNLEQSSSRLPLLQFVGLGQQDMNWQIDLVGKGHHLPVIIFELATDIDNHQQTLEALPDSEIVR